MNKSLTKREFLKLLALLPPSFYLSRGLFQEPDRPLLDPNAKNVLVIVFDALSATNVSLYGYSRPTMPNLARLAERGTVYHNHYAAGNWTVPGTASLLTGTYPWTHRAFTDGVRLVAKDKESHNVFNLFDQYFRAGYSHNGNVDNFLHQFSHYIDKLENQTELFIENYLSLDRYFPLDNDIAPITWDRMMEEDDKGYTYSLFFAPFYQKYSENLKKKFLVNFPRGLPHTGVDDNFLLEVGIDWLISELNTIQRPFLGYFHFLPPHRPYNTRREFINVFKNDAVGAYMDKPKSFFIGSGEVDEPVNLKNQAKQRQFYDEFILYADSELGRLYDWLEKSGMLENTWLVFTSDHGEMCERGIFGHRTPVLYQPIVQVPLIIMEPGQKTRRDVFTPTSAVDLLPTLLKVTNQKIPDWAEGTVMEPFSDSPSAADRSIYALEAKYSDPFGVLNPATTMLVKGNYKLTHYFGYEQLGKTRRLFELYDVENDPEELKNIYDPNWQTAKQLQDELLEKIKEVDKPYQKN
jgi:arylsulfatase A-like enzyme